MHVNAFLRKLDLVDFELAEIPEEQGDFTLLINKKKIAIEETQLLYVTDDGLSRMQFKKNCQFIVQKSEDLFKRLDFKQELEVRVSFLDNSGLIHFDKDSMVKFSDIESLAESICKLVVKHCPPVGAYISLDHYDMELSVTLPRKIDSIRITDVTGKWKGFFSTSGGYMVPRLTSENIQQKIDNKELKAIKYKNLYDEFWLLITLNTFSFTGHYDLDYINEVINHNFISSFDKLYLYDMGTNESFELKISK